MGANLLLNIGPQPSGELPVVALERLKGMGEWLRENGESIYETVAGDIKPQSWGVTTRKGDVLYVHILNLKENSLYLPLNFSVKSITTLADGRKIRYEKTQDGVILKFDEAIVGPDYIIKIVEKR
jgi:alpha-L-fucosidase